VRELESDRERGMEGEREVMRQRASDERDRNIIRNRQGEETGRKRERERRDMESMGAIE